MSDSVSGLAVRRRTVPLEEADDIIHDDVSDDVITGKRGGGGGGHDHAAMVPDEDHSLRHSGHLRTSQHSTDHHNNSQRIRVRRPAAGEDNNNESSRRGSRRNQHQHNNNDDSSSVSTSRRGSSSRLDRGSGHSRGSISSAPSISTDELKKMYPRKGQRPRRNSSSSSHSRSGRNGRTTSGGGTGNGGMATTAKTPSTSRRNKLTIGKDNVGILSSTQSLVHTVASSMPQGADFLEQSENNKEGSDGINTNVITPAATHQKQSVKTPFEVDRPRLLPQAPLSSDASAVSDLLEVDPTLSEEQDAWAGIDNLLLSSTASMDDSCVFSMCDILPKDTVKAMRRSRNSSSADSVMTYGDESVMEENIDDDSNAKRSVSAMSKNSNGSCSSSSGSRKGKKDNKPSPSTSKHNRKHANNVDGVNNSAEGGGGVASGGNLFDVFHWSDKTNVDESRQRKGKLNQPINKNRLKTVRLASTVSKSSRNSQESDDMSMPSLASFRPDELNLSRKSSWLGDSRHTSDVSSVVTEDLGEFGEEDNDVSYEHGEVLEETTIDSSIRSTESPSHSSGDGGSSSSSFAGDGLVLNKQVDEYITMIQMKLPTISEDGGGISSPVAKNIAGDASLVEETSPSPTSIVEDSSPFEQLPSLASLSEETKVGSSAPSSSSTLGSKASKGSQQSGSSSHSRKSMVEKKEPKQSFSVQLMSSMSSIKSLGSFLPTSKKKAAIANGDEEKYFPKEEPDSPTQSVQFRPGQSLLSELDDRY